MAAEKGERTPVDGLNEMLPPGVYVDEHVEDAEGRSACVACMQGFRSPATHRTPSDEIPSTTQTTLRYTKLSLQHGFRSHYAAYTPCSRP
ncbi:hypothetical protein PsYK624_101370 [Phanerochaete sordida]|uniref:Uncharacterized protein n=1 Tax=Phanerochaete sordida TaxID=48140 RepID=A0A9P3LG58_9APHY|nr:hypothetical protein PsYK624_101370 [Phanerochaete sordida]